MPPIRRGPTGATGRRALRTTVVVASILLAGCDRDGTSALGPSTLHDAAAHRAAAGEFASDAAPAGVTSQGAVPVVGSLSVTEDTLRVVTGAGAYITSTVRDADGHEIVAPVRSYRTANLKIGATNAAGRMTARAVLGTTTVAVSSGGKSDTAVVIVERRTGAPVAEVRSWPDTLHLAPGQSGYIRTNVHDTRGVIVPAALAFRTSNLALASTAADGRVTAKKVPGTTKVGITAAGKTDTVVVVVTAIASVTASPDTLRLTRGRRGTITPLALDARGIRATPAFSYRTLDLTLGSTSAKGVVTARQKIGATEVVVTAAGKADTVVVVVDAAPLSTVTLEPAAVALEPGARRTVAASARTSLGTAAQAPGMTWRSTNAAVATVDARGTITAVAPGTAEVVATSWNGVSARATVTVTAPLPPVRERRSLDPVAVATAMQGAGGEPVLFGGIMLAGDLMDAPLQALVEYPLDSFPANGTLELARITLHVPAEGVFGAPADLGTLVVERATAPWLATAVPSSSAVRVATADGTAVVDVTRFVREARTAGEATLVLRARFAAPALVNGADDYQELLAGPAELTYTRPASGAVYPTAVPVTAPTTFARLELRPGSAADRPGESRARARSGSRRLPTDLPPAPSRGRPRR